MGLFQNIAAAAREGRDAALADYRVRPQPPRRPPPRRDDVPAEPDGPSPIILGNYHDREADELGEAMLYYGERHVLVYGVNGAGKSTRLLIENLMRLTGRSIVVIDMKGELCYQTYRERLKYSDVKIINPYGLLGLRSDGYNILSVLDDRSPKFYDAAASIADALIEIESGAGQYWSESAQGLLVALIMFEVILAKKQRRAPDLYNVRMMLCEADEYEDFTDSNGKKRQRAIKGLSATAERMIASGNKTIANLVGRFKRKEGRNEIASIQSTALTQTEWMESEAMQRDMRKQGTDLRQLRQKPTTIYIVMDAEEITRKRKWTRALIAEAISAHFTPGPVDTLFILDEFRASVGKMRIINDMWSVVRGYGVTLMPILQSALQLKALFGDEWENYAAQAGIIMTLGGPNDLFTANWMSERCGVTTILQASYSASDGVNNSDNTNAGSGFNPGGASTNQGQGSGFGRNAGGSLNFTQTERRVMLAQELMELPNGHGRIWVPGWGSLSIPFFAANYWRRREAWVARVRENPYYARKVRR